MKRKRRKKRPVPPRPTTDALDNQPAGSAPVQRLQAVLKELNPTDEPQAEN